MSSRALWVVDSWANLSPKGKSLVQEDDFKTGTHTEKECQKN